MTTVFTLNPTQAHYAIMMLESSLAESKNSLDAVYNVIRAVKFWSKVRSLEAAKSDLLALKQHLNAHGYYFTYQDLSSFWEKNENGEDIYNDDLEADYVRQMWQPTANGFVPLTALQANAVASTLVGSDYQMKFINWIDSLEGNGALDPTTPSVYIDQFEKRLDVQGYSFWNFHHEKYYQIAHKRKKQK